MSSSKALSSLPVVDGQGIDWVKKSFLIPRLLGNQFDPKRDGRKRDWYDNRFHIYGLAATKFTDSSLGGNFAINPLPQFSKYADPRVPTFAMTSGATRRKDYDGTEKNNLSGGNGMGRYYSEAYDDNAQIIYMRMGKPEFNSLTTFFTGFYNSDASLLARRGRAAGLFYSVGKVAGTIASIPFIPFMAAGTIFRFAAQNPASKFYYSRPTMPLYWNAVNTIANGIAVNMGLYPRPVTDQEQQLANNAGSPGGAPDGGDFDRMAQLMPDLYFKNGGIDIYAMANRATRSAHEYEKTLQALIEGSTNETDLNTKIEQFLSTPLASPATPDIDSILKKFHESGLGSKEPPNVDDNGRGGFVDGVKGWYDDLVTFGEAELADGSAFACFRVDHTGTATESFSNSVRDSDIASTINSGSSSARNARFNFAEGNAGGGMIGDMVGGVVNSVKDLTVGVIDGIQMSGLLAVMGSAFVDIPKHWDNATANLTTMSYTMQLQAWSGDKYTRFQSLMVPLSMILAAALPNATGKKSYTAPFLVELFSKGRAQTRLGLIDSLTITRGTGNVGWTKNGECLGIDIQFSVVDLSSIMTMPIASNFSLNPLDGVFDDDNTFNDYLAVLGGLGLADQVYFRRRLRLALARKMTSYRQWTSPARYASWANGTDIGRLFNALSREIGRP